MSEQVIRALEAMDSVFTSGVAATLTGLSLTAASLLVNLVKSQGEKVKELSKNVQETELAAANKGDPAHRIALEDSLLLARNNYQSALAAADGIKNAFRAMIVGFVAFAFNLVESLTLDPIVSLLTAGGLSKEETFFTLSNYTPWLVADVALSFTSLTIGLGALCYAAAKMARAVPHL